MATGKKTGGRVAGTPNRTTKETKELLQKIVNNEIDNLGEMLGKLEPLERVNAIAKLLPYIVPKQSEVSVNEPETPKKLIIKVNRRT
ncbi:hypothetical protein Q1W71_22085 [Flavobacterium pectinovorum]|uniref:hypothetical protein n=1 Tax=Flavobacterium pectinovorum TaxID=29533 RepID=UPI00265F2F38|nr:hypothetical protein [Flavobacterium pectinovorum]WKL47632.1 hypothetical protein Q1W71_22085 [Flavobacterium pectinovorum]